MALRVAEHAAAGLLTGALVATVLRVLPVQVAARRVEVSLVGGCAAILFTIADGGPTDLAWSAGVAAAAGVLYVAALSAVHGSARRRRTTSGA
jgi:hypothetical protein